MRGDVPGGKGSLLSLHSKVNDQIAARQPDAAERHPPYVAAGDPSGVRYGQGTLRCHCSRPLAVPAAIGAGPTLPVAGGAHDACRNLHAERSTPAGLSGREAHFDRQLACCSGRPTPGPETAPPLIQNAVERREKGLVEEGARLAVGRLGRDQRLNWGAPRTHRLGLHSSACRRRQPALRLLPIVGAPPRWIAQYFVGLS
jgi:hypothetical protein